MELQNLLRKINALRKNTLPLFSIITFSPAAIRLVSRLFLHPYCMNTTDLQKFIGSKPIPLSLLSRHILTAFPQTICAYAYAHHKKLITAKDILRCFALDHCSDIAKNRLENIYSPAYALAHTLALGVVQKIRHQKDECIADLRIKNSKKEIILKNAFVPADLQCHQGDPVFEHFGAVIEIAHTHNLWPLSQDLNQRQSKMAYFQKIFQLSPPEIDFGRPGLYPFDLLEKIRTKAKRPGENKKIPPGFKIKTKGKVFFAQ